MLLWKPQHNLGFPSFCLFIFYKHWPLQVLPSWSCSLQNQFFFIVSTSLCKYIFQYIAFHNITVITSKHFFCNKYCIICYPLANSVPKHLALSLLGEKGKKSLMVIKLSLLGLHLGKKHISNLPSPRVSNMHL